MLKTPDNDLFSPTALGAIEVANRIAMAPLTRSRAHEDGVHSSLAIEYYRQRAAAGLIITEATNISRQGTGYSLTPGIYTDAHVRAWMPITAAVHAAGSKIVCQLWHVGRMSHVSVQEDGKAPVAPSAIQGGEQVFTLDGMQRPSMPRALETDEIPGIVEDYRNAARKAKAAGFDGVEVHSGNCYLLEQFIRDSTNQRTDKYGGSVVNRTRLPLEVVRAVADIWGPNRVGIRLSPITHATGATPFDSTPQVTYFHLARELGKLKLAYLHCIEGQTRGANAASTFDFEALRDTFGGRYIANNGYDRDLAIKAIDSGHADMVAFGHHFIGNPDLVDRLHRDAPLSEAPVSAYYGGGAHGYTDFKTLEQEERR